jgi:hypothetical protein
VAALFRRLRARAAWWRRGRRRSLRPPPRRGDGLEREGEGEQGGLVEEDSPPLGNNGLGRFSSSTVCHAVGRAPSPSSLSSPATEGRARACLRPPSPSPSERRLRPSSSLGPPPSLFPLLRPHSLTRPPHARPRSTTTGSPRWRTRALSLRLAANEAVVVFAAAAVASTGEAYAIREKERKSSVSHARMPDYDPPQEEKNAKGGGDRQRQRRRRPILLLLVCKESHYHVKANASACAGKLISSAESVVNVSSS